MPGLAISLLGPFELRLDGILITHFESVKVRALLAYLAAEAGNPQPRASLAGLLWSDWPDEAAHKNLRHTFYSLRKMMNNPACFDSDRQFITLNPGDDCQVDVLEFEQALADASGSLTTEEVDRLSAAVGRYRGPFLEGFTLDDSPAFEEWILNRRQHHSRQVLKALSLLEDWHEKMGNLEEAEQFARHQLTIEPWRERAHQQLMQLLALKGERVQALAQFECLKNVLKSELGVEPSVETILLFEQIRAGRFAVQAKPSITLSAVPPKPSHNLPLRLSSFIGREKEVGQVKDMLSRYHLVTLTGPGGVGKTRLAIRSAEQIVEHFPDGVWYIELAPLADAGLVPATAGRIMGLYESAGQDILELLSNILETKKALLVLDNCEHVLDGCIHLADTLLTHCPYLSILTTSREPLSMEGEAIVRVQPFSFPDSDQMLLVNQFQDWDAIRFFVERTQAILPEFSLNEHNVKAVAEICQRLDGIPLALELAAARLDLLSPAQLASRLKDSFRLLTGGSRTALPRHQTLRATIEWSYNLLSEAEKALFLRLAIFAGSFSLEGVEVVCGEDYLDIDSAVELLSALISKSMVTTLYEPDQEPRYRLLETVRQYAQERLLTSNQMTILRDRHLDYYQELAERAELGLRSPQQIPLLRQLEQELPNIRLALDWANDESGVVEDRLAKGLRLCSALLYFWHPRCRHLEGIEWLERLLCLEQQRRNGAAPSNSMCQVRGKALWTLELLCEHVSFVVDRETLLNESFSLFQRLGEAGKHGLTLVKFSLATVHKDEDFQGAWCQLEDCYATFQELGDKFHMSECLLGLNALAAGRCVFVRANRYLLDCLKLRYEIGDHDGESQFLTNLGLRAARIGDFERAREYITKAKASLLLYEEVLYASGWTHISLGLFAWQEGDYIQAEKEFHQGCIADRQRGFTGLSAMQHLGELALSQGDYPKAAELFHELLPEANKKKIVFNITGCILGLANLAWATRDFAEAGRLYEVVLESNADWVQNAFAYTGLAKIALMQGKKWFAADHFAQALKIWRKNTSMYYDGHETLELVAALMFKLESLEASAMLFGATRLSYQCFRLTYPPLQRQLMDDSIATTRDKLDKVAFGAAYEKGQTMDMDQTLELALSLVSEML